MQWLHSHYWLCFVFLFPRCFVCETVVCLKSWKIKSNSIPMSGSKPLLNYSSVWNHPSPKMSAMQTNVVICRAFYHARFGALGSITNEIFLLRGPSGEIWWFPLSLFEFIPPLVSSSRSSRLTVLSFSFFYLVCPSCFFWCILLFLSLHVPSLQTTFDH